MKGALTVTKNKARRRTLHIRCPKCLGDMYQLETPELLAGMDGQPSFECGMCHETFEAEKLITVPTREQGK